MLRRAYIAGVESARSKFGFAVGMGASSGRDGVGAVRGYPLDSDEQRRKNTIDRAFATNENLPGATSSTDEPPMKMGAQAVGTAMQTMGVTPKPAVKPLKPLQPFKFNDGDADQRARGDLLSQSSMNHTAKLGLDSSKKCGTCKQDQHYGACKLKKIGTPGEGTPFIRMRERTAGFNFSMRGYDGKNNDSYDNSTGENTLLHHTSGTSDEPMTRARNTDPRNQVQSAIQALQSQSLNNVADEWGNATGALNKTSEELRGTVNPYAERLQHLSPPIAAGLPQTQQIDQLFKYIDMPQDTASIENASPSDALLVP